MSKQTGLHFLHFFFSLFFFFFCWKLRAFRTSHNPAFPAAGAGGLLPRVQPCLALLTFIGFSSPFALRWSFLFLLDGCFFNFLFSSLAHLYPVFPCSIHFPLLLMLPKKLLCSGNVLVVTVMTFKISFFLVMCTWCLILNFSLGWGVCYCSAHLPCTVFVSTATGTIQLSVLCDT